MFKTARIVSVTLAILCVLIWGAIIFGPSGAEKDLRQILQAAQNAENAGRYAEALELYEQGEPGQILFCI